MLLVDRIRCAFLFAAAVVVWSLPAGAGRSLDGPRFRLDDPLSREPDTQDASSTREWEIDLFIDLAVNLFAQPGGTNSGIRALNVNTIDEVPDSSWFTNRIGARPVSIDEAVNAASTGPGIAPGPWTIVASKQSGFSPGFTILDTAGERWFISFDARGYPEAATGAVMVANRIFWTLGYWQADQLLTKVRPDQVLLGDSAKVRPMSGKVRRMRASDMEEVWRRAHRSPDGSFRAVAARALPGEPLGGFRYYGTRPDDPNDVIPHEHRRELRALQVFGAWTNLVDIKAGNTLDMLVRENERSLVRHYLQDVGSTFGTGALGPREYFEGWEHLYEGDLVWRRLVSLGFFVRPWQRIPYDDRPSIGRFESAAFDPRAWKPRVPAAALRHARADDLFWAARRVMAFSNEMIRALAATGKFSDPDDERHLADTLIARRDKIGAAYLASVSPIVDFTMSPDGSLSFQNAAVLAGVAPPPRGGYRFSWAYFENETSVLDPIGEVESLNGERVPPPVRLRTTSGSFVRVRVSVVPPAPVQWCPVDAYFRRADDEWTLVGIDRDAAVPGDEESVRTGPVGARRCIAPVRPSSAR